MIDTDIDNEPIIPDDPDETVLNWIRSIESEDFPLKIIGKSLKHFRSRSGVTIFRLKKEQSDFNARRLFPDDSTGNNPRILDDRSSDDEYKLHVYFPGQDLENIFIIEKASVPAKDDKELTVSVDLLEYDPVEGRWTGPRDSLIDRESRTVRAIHPGHITAPDALVLSSLCSRLDSKMDSMTAEKAREAFRKNDPEQFTRRFIQKILVRIVTGAKPSNGFLALDSIDALEWFIPELAAGKGITQNRFHLYDILMHNLYTCDHVQPPDLEIRLAGLFHDMGKVDTRKERSEGEVTFYNHEIVSAKHADYVLKRFGFPYELRKRVRFLVRNHMFHYTSEWSDRAIRRFMRRIEPDTLENLITLRLADRKGSGKKQALPRAIRELIRHIEEVKEKEAELKVRDLAIDGHALMDMGMTPGPRMGDVLNELLKRVKSGELENLEELLKKEAKQILENLPPAGYRPQDFDESEENSL